MSHPLIKKIRELAAAAPDNVYTESPCRYSTGACTNGSVGCIVGQALIALGYAGVADLDAREYVPTASQACYILGILADEFDHGESEVEWIETVQANQDRKRTWGEAVQEADSVVRLQRDN